MQVIINKEKLELNFCLQLAFRGNDESLIENLQADLMNTAQASSFQRVRYFIEEMIEQAWEGVIEKSMDNSKSHVDNDLLENELRGELAKAIDCLDPKEKQVISLYY